MRRLELTALSALLLTLAACTTPNGNSPSSGSGAYGNNAPQRPRIGSVNTLLGLSPEKVTSLLGEPKIKRAEKEAQIWQYRSSACSLLLFFYPNTDGQITAYYVDARRPEGGAAEKGACLNSIEQAGRGS